MKIHSESFYYIIIDSVIDSVIDFVADLLGSLSCKREGSPI